MTEVPQAEEIVANAEPLNLEDIIEIISDEVAKGFAKDMGIWHDIRNGERDASFFLKVHPLPFGRMSEDAKHFVPLAFGDNSKVRATVGSSFEDLSRKALQGDSIIRKNIAEGIDLHVKVEKPDVPTQPNSAYRIVSADVCVEKGLAEKMLQELFNAEAENTNLQSV
ncbi:MAG: hypothetical protein COY80_02785 [Candidatus Pacebacteria bacterium CG_4_10_14_0_8_um_filter_42_14]|nr:MAG: hypothetical protein COY80_02785 [Candidatus Pacebacteria bacterium CG_4_10_14_0_8_um_filter_42_14]